MPVYTQIASSLPLGARPAYSLPWLSTSPTTKHSGAVGRIDVRLTFIFVGGPAETLTRLWHLIRRPCNAMRMSLRAIDYVILALYFVFVLTIGFRARKRVKTSDEFLTAHHSVPVWTTSLAFIAANLGPQEAMGMCASVPNNGLMTA